jgi:hypothetical protein
MREFFTELQTVRTQNIRSLTNIVVKISRMFHCVLFYVITPACDLAVLIIIIITITIIIQQLDLFLLVLYCVNRSKFRCLGHLSLNVIAIFNFLLDIINNRLTMDKPATSVAWLCWASNQCTFIIISRHNNLFNC